MLKCLSSPVLLTLKTSFTITRLILPIACHAGDNRQPGPGLDPNRRLLLRAIISLWACRRSSTTVTFWRVTFWQMLLLARKHFSWVSFCLITYPLCLRQKHTVRQSPPPSENHRCLSPGGHTLPTCEPGIRKLSCGRGCSRWRDRCPVCGDRGRGDKGGGGGTGGEKLQH